MTNATMTRDKIDALADWSSLPRVMYITSVRCIDGVVYEASTASVPMAIAPEVAYVSLTTIPGLADVLDGKAVIVPVTATQEMADAAFRHMILRNSMRESLTKAIAASPYRKEPEA